MKYRVNGTEVSLPLSVDSIEIAISYIKNTTVPEEQQGQKLELYRDVLICIRNGASHGNQLATAALKLEEVE